jgi:hypothetical protein
MDLQTLAILIAALMVLEMNIVAQDLMLTQHALRHHRKFLHKQNFKHKVIMSFKIFRPPPQPLCANGSPDSSYPYCCANGAQNEYCCSGPWVNPTCSAPPP